MKKIIAVVLVVIILGLAVIILNRNILARFIIVRGIKQACGLQVAIGGINIGLPDVSVKDLKIYNPEGYPERLMAEIPELYFSFDLPAFFKNKVHMAKIRVQVARLNLILNDQGKLNVNSLGLLIPKKGAGKPPEIQIDELWLKIGKVSYNTAVPTAGAAGEFDFNFEETFHNVTDPYRITSQVLQKVIARTSLKNLTDIVPVQGQEQGMLGTVETGIKTFLSPEKK